MSERFADMFVAKGCPRPRFGQTWYPGPIVICVTVGFGATMLAFWAYANDAVFDVMLASTETPDEKVSLAVPVWVPEMMKVSLVLEVAE